MTGKWIVRTGTLLILLGYVLPSFSVSCTAMPGLGETYSILDISDQESLLYLVPLCACVILILALLNAKTSAQEKGFFWGQIAGIGVGIASILITMSSFTNEIQQYGLEISPEIGIFILGTGFIAVGVGLAKQWTEMKRDPLPMTIRANGMFQTSKLHQPSDSQQKPTQPEFPKTLPASPAALNTRLELVRGQIPENIIPILKTDFTIGRGSLNDLVLSDPEVSRQHVRIRYAQGVWFIQDQDSKAGILVNGQPVRASRIQPGDKITIGETIFTFMEG